MPKFNHGDLVVSIHTGQIVRVDAVNENENSFSGRYIGDKGRVENMPPNFQYNWTRWALEAFEKIPA
jgi:hypothetical protein